MRQPTPRSFNPLRSIIGWDDSFRWYDDINTARRSDGALDYRETSDNRSIFSGTIVTLDMWMRCFVIDVIIISINNPDGDASRDAMVPCGTQGRLIQVQSILDHISIYIARIWVIRWSHLKQLVWMNTHTPVKQWQTILQHPNTWLVASITHLHASANCFKLDAYEWKDA